MLIPTPRRAFCATSPTAAITTPGELDEVQRHPAPGLQRREQQHLDGWSSREGFANQLAAGRTKGRGGSESLTNTVNIKINRLPDRNGQHKQPLAKRLSTDDVSTTTGNVLTDATNETDPDLDAVHSGNDDRPDGKLPRRQPEASPAWCMTRRPTPSSSAVSGAATAKSLAPMACSEHRQRAIGSYTLTGWTTPTAPDRSDRHCRGAHRHLHFHGDRMAMAASPATRWTITIIGTNDYPEVTKATGGAETHWSYHNNL